MTDQSPPRIDLRLLRQFVAVAEELHFTRASARLAVSQPSLTAAIRRLETEVGATLIERGQKTIKLTGPGRAMLAEARRVLQAASDALAVTRNVAAGKRGRIRLGYVGSAMYGRLPSAIRTFRHSHPDVYVELREMTTAAQIAAIRACNLDLAIVIPPLGEVGGLQISAFDTDELAIALPIAHPLAQSANMSVADLSEQPFVFWPRDQGPGFHDRVSRLCSDAGFTPAIVQEAHGMHAVLSLVAVEIGVAIVPASMASIRNGEIAYRKISDEAARFELMVCRDGSAADPAMAQFLASLSQ